MRRDWEFVGLMNVTTSSHWFSGRKRDADLFRVLIKKSSRISCSTSYWISPERKGYLTTKLVIIRVERNDSDDNYSLISVFIICVILSLEMSPVLVQTVVCFKDTFWDFVSIGRGQFENISISVVSWKILDNKYNNYENKHKVGNVDRKIDQLSWPSLDIMLIN